MMKVIDLLNKIANGEEVPRIQYDDVEAYIGADGYLKDNYGDNVEWWIDKNWLNTEVEIIEDKKIEKIELEDDGYTISLSCKKKNEWTILDNVEVEICNKINEIIDYLEENK